MTKIRVSKIRVSKIKVSEIRVSEIKVSKIRVSKISVSEIRISSNHRELHGAIFSWVHQRGMSCRGFDRIYEDVSTSVTLVS